MTIPSTLSEERCREILAEQISATMEFTADRLRRGVVDANIEVISIKHALAAMQQAVKEARGKR